MSTVPLFPLGSPLFPGMVLPLHIFEPRYRQLVADLLALDEPGVFGVVYIREGHEVGDESARALSDVGTIAVVRAVATLPDGRYELVAIGRERFHLQRVVKGAKPYLQAEVVPVEDPPPGDLAQLAERARSAFDAYLAAVPAELADDLPDDPEVLPYHLALHVVLPPADRQRVLAAADAAERLTVVQHLIERETTVLQRLRAVPANGFLRTGMSPN